jgi:hypothetical protein
MQMARLHQPPKAATTKYGGPARGYRYGKVERIVGRKMSARERDVARIIMRRYTQ